MAMDGCINFLERRYKQYRGHFRSIYTKAWNTFAAKGHKILCTNSHQHHMMYHQRDKDYWLASEACAFALEPSLPPLVGKEKLP